MLAALACTDYITIFDELTPIELLKIIQPQIHVNSPEHGEDCVERDIVEHYGGRIHLAHLIEGMSTTQLIERIVDVTSHTPVRAIFLNVSDLWEIERTSPAHRISEVTLKTLGQFNALNFCLFLLIRPPEISGEPLSKNQIFRQTIQAQQFLSGKGIKISGVYQSNCRDCETREAQHKENTSSQHPEPACLEQAVEDYNVVLAKSFLISGAIADIQIGRELNCKTIFLKTVTDGLEEFAGSSGPHFIAKNLQEAINFIT
jgi:histidinol phosphatase-like enzyme